MLKITPIEGSPDQFTATMNNMDIYALHAAIKAASTLEKVEHCGCRKCAHMVTVVTEVKRVTEFIEREQKQSLASKLFELEFGKISEDLPKTGIREIDPNSEDGKKIIAALRTLGIIKE